MNMRRSFLAVGIMALALSSAGQARGGVSTSSDGDHYSQAALKQMTRDARTPEQYKNLASTYAKQQAYFLRVAAEEKAEWQRRSQNIVSINAKYPRPVDSARNLYEYYVREASEAGTFSAKYDQMAGTSTR
jgi:hypothetical protein